MQFWSLTQLKVLKLDRMKLNKLPASVGRLQDLEELSISSNKLSDLPITLGFCKKLKKLSLQNNQFRAIPGIVLTLQELEDLRRLNNPLIMRYDMQSHPHIQSRQVKSTGKGPWNPDSLQSLAVKRMMNSQLNYWQKESLPPLQCRIMDSLAASYQYCEHCCNAIAGTG